MKKRSRLFLIVAMISIFSLSTLSPISADTNGDSGSQSLMFEFTVFSAAYGYLIQKYSPIAKWKNEIEKLAQDQHSLESLMEISTDPIEVQRAQEAIDKAEGEKVVIKKKMSRFKKWFYPAATVVGTAGIFLIEHLLRGSN